MQQKYIHNYSIIIHDRTYALIDTSPENCMPPMCFSNAPQVHGQTHRKDGLGNGWLRCLIAWFHDAYVCHKPMDVQVNMLIVER